MLLAWGEGERSGVSGEQLQLRRYRSLEKKLVRPEACALIGMSVGIIVGAAGLYEITKNPAANVSITPDLGHKLLFAGIVIVMAALIAEMTIRSVASYAKGTVDFIESEAENDASTKRAFEISAGARIGSFTAMVIAAGFTAEVFKGVMLHGNSIGQVARNSNLHIAAISALIAVGLALLALGADEYTLKKADSKAEGVLSEEEVQSRNNSSFFRYSAPGTLFALGSVGIAAGAALVGAVVVAGTFMMMPGLCILGNIVSDVLKSKDDELTTLDNRNLQLGGNIAAFVGATGACMTTAWISGHYGAASVADLHASLFQMMLLIVSALVMAVGVIIAAVGKERQGKEVSDVLFSPLNA